MSTKMVLANKTNKQALDEWELFLNSIKDSTPIDLNLTEAEKANRLKWLEKPGNEEEWFMEFFPKFCFAPPTNFHKKSTRKFLKAKRLYQRRGWARGLAKSTRRMMEIFYKMFVQKLRVNMLLISKNESNAARLLAPYRGNLEANQRLQFYYGKQQGSKWTEDEFVTRKKCAFRAVGAEQNPRGAKLDELRPNVLVFDDVDDDEVCQNADRLNKRWLWIEQAVIPTIDIAADYFILFDNNIISEDSLAVRAAAFADDVETVNIRDTEGKSTWPEKNSDADIADIEKKLSYESFEKEYMNNPMSQGKTFPEMVWGKCPPIKSLPFAQIYCDPAPSNKDKPALKSTAQTSSKAVFLMGSDGIKFYVYYGFLYQVNNGTFTDWMFLTYQYAQQKGSKQTFLDVENNTLQDPFFQQVLKPLVVIKQKEFGIMLPMAGDDRDKPDKWVRVESLEQLNRNGLLILNIDEKDNPHMKRLETQFKAAKATSKQLDGPDCIEGGVFKIKGRIITANADATKWGVRKPNAKRF